MLKWIIQEFLNFEWPLTIENSRISVVFGIPLKAYRKSMDIEVKIIIKFGKKTNHMYRKQCTDFFQFVWAGPSVCSSRGVRIHQIPILAVWVQFFIPYVNCCEKVMSSAPTPHYTYQASFCYPVKKCHTKTKAILHTVNYVIWVQFISFHFAVFLSVWLH